MTAELFITLLVTSAAAASAAVQIIKTFLEKAGIVYKGLPLAVITAFVIGAAEVPLFYAAHDMTVGISTVLYAVCMGIANAVSATCGYDMVKNFIYALLGKTR